MRILGKVARSLPLALVAASLMMGTAVPARAEATGGLFDRLFGGGDIPYKPRYYPREAYPDASALDSADSHFDPKSKREDPTWFMVDIRAVEALPRPVSLDEVKKTKGLEDMALVRLGRL